MGCLQACGFFSEQMPCEVAIDVNMFLGAFSIEIDGQRIHPPSWVPSENNSVTIVPSASTSSTPPSDPSILPPTNFDIDDYRRCRQAEALRWIDLQEKRASIIARIPPTTAEEYQKLRDAVMSETGPLRRKLKKQIGIRKNLFIFYSQLNIPFVLLIQQLNGPHKMKTIAILPPYRSIRQIFLQYVSQF